MLASHYFVKEYTLYNLYKKKNNACIVFLFYYLFYTRSYMKKSFLFLFLACIMPVTTFAQSSNIGIVTGIWFSEDVFFSGDPIRIYTAVQNNSGEDIEGDVEFFDNDISIGKKDFTAPNSRVVEVWLDTTVTKGQHDYSVTFTEAQINKSGEVPKTITPRSIKSSDTIIVDNDSDGDNIGDTEDLDDDNDGFSDIEEITKGSDPLDKNSIPLQENIDMNTTRSDLDSNSFVNDVLAIFKSENNTSLGNNSEILSDVDRELLLIEKPNFIQNIENSYPAIERVTTPLNSFQNNIIPIIITERKKVIDKIQPESITNKVLQQGIETNIDALVEYDHGLVGWQYWMWSIYSWILLGIQWISSSLISMILLIFIGIHLFLKLLFRIFRPKN